MTLSVCGPFTEDLCVSCIEFIYFNNLNCYVSLFLCVVIQNVQMCCEF